MARTKTEAAKVTAPAKKATTKAPVKKAAGKAVAKPPAKAAAPVKKAVGKAAAKPPVKKAVAKKTTAPVKVAEKTKPLAKSDVSKTDVSKLPRLEALQMLKEEFNLTEADIKKSSGKAKLTVADIREALKNAIAPGKTSDDADEAPTEKTEDEAPTEKKTKKSKTGKTASKDEAPTKPKKTGKTASEDDKYVKLENQIKALEKQHVADTKRITALEKDVAKISGLEKEFLKIEELLERLTAQMGKEEKKPVKVAEKKTKKETVIIKEEPELHATEGYSKDSNGFLYTVDKKPKVIARMDGDKMIALRKKDMEELEKAGIKHEKKAIADVRKTFDASKKAEAVKDVKEDDEEEVLEDDDEEGGVVEDTETVTSSEETSEDDTSSSDDKEEASGKAKEASSDDEETEGDESKENLDENTTKASSTSDVQKVKEKPKKDTPAEGTEVSKHFVEKPKVTQEVFKKYKKLADAGALSDDVDQDAKLLGIDVVTLEYIIANEGALANKFAVAEVDKKTTNGLLKTNRK